ncbi:uncharacterized protein LOC126735632 [Anthonomus grandis grandis]|uniref:uncharacterized protein LOC126735632 n=1 Tax=Anthonomus grandis grandis TaxID=2921223 RepID=UPI0021660B93|nr:uncharacterized protein LOC126735632 [Anthonomus grandis grandis]
MGFPSNQELCDEHGTDSSKYDDGPETPNTKFKALEIFPKTTHVRELFDLIGEPHYTRVFVPVNIFNEDDDIISVTMISKLLHMICGPVPEIKPRKKTTENTGSFTADSEKAKGKLKKSTTGFESQSTEIKANFADDKSENEKSESRSGDMSSRVFGNNKRLGKRTVNAEFYSGDKSFDSTVSSESGSRANLKKSLESESRGSREGFDMKTTSDNKSGSGKLIEISKENIISDELKKGEIERSPGFMSESEKDKKIPDGIEKKV